MATTLYDPNLYTRLLPTLRQIEATTGRPTSPSVLRELLRAQLDAATGRSLQASQLDLQRQYLKNAAKEQKAQGQAATIGGAVQLVGAVGKGIQYWKGAPATGLTQPQIGQNIVNAAQTAYQAGVGSAGAVTAPTAATAALPSIATAPASLSAATPAYVAPTTVSYGAVGGTLGQGVGATAAPTTAAVGAGSVALGALGPLAAGFGTGMLVSGLASGIEDTETRRAVSQVGGAASGAAAGALAGSVVPVIGTAIGAVIGGITGLIGGAGGNKPGEKKREPDRVVSFG